MDRIIVTLDLNCDLGEGEPPSRTRALLRWVTSANIACGGHAGGARSMQRCIALAKEYQVRLGAHPGASAGAFGRGRVEMTPDELELLVLQQVGALMTLAREQKCVLHHIKLHGSLYHATENDARLRRRYLSVVERWWPAAIIYCRAGGSVSHEAKARGLKVWNEVFLDRGYHEDGTLVPRGEPGALITKPGEIKKRIELLQTKGWIETASGQPFRASPETLCVHSDTPGAVAIARTAAAALQLARAHVAGTKR